MTIDRSSPIDVKSENLILDFSDGNNDSYSVAANVTAEYEMTNPTNETQFVQMAFPFIERLGNINYNDIIITADDKELPYEVYIGKSINSYGKNLPEEDLSFTLYSKEKITMLDKVEGQINRSFGYFAPIVIGIFVIFIVIISIIIVRKFKKK